MDEKLEYFKKKILAHLDDLEQKENAEKKEPINKQTEVWHVSG